MTDSKKHRLAVLSPEASNDINKIISNTVNTITKQLMKHSNYRLKVHMCASLYKEALACARSSIKFHEDTNEPNLYKEVGHFCFWIIKLKPFRLTLEQNGEEAIVSESKMRIFPINETISLYFALKVISTAESMYIDYCVEENNLDLEVANAKKQKISDIITTSENKASKVIHSYRRHNYSARAMATSFEWVFGSIDSFCWES